MKKLFCLLAVFAVLATMLTVFAVATKEEDEQILNAEPSPTATATNVSPVLRGDAYHDGVINMKDVLAVRQYLADIPTDIDLAAADANGDGAVNMKDVLKLRKMIAAGDRDIFDLNDYITPIWIKCMCPFGHCTAIWNGDGKVYNLFCWRATSAGAVENRMEDFTAEYRDFGCLSHKASFKFPAVILDGLQNLGDYLFYNYPDVEKLYIPDSVTEIGEHTFCDNCKTVIACHKGSYAESYANAHGMTVEIVE